MIGFHLSLYLIFSACNSQELQCKFYSLNLKVKWVCSLQYIFYLLFNIYGRYDTFSRTNTDGAKLSPGVINILKSWS